MKAHLSGKLEITCIEAKRLENKDWMGKQNPYCKVKIGGEKLATKADHHGGEDPSWNESLTFNLRNSAATTPVVITCNASEVISHARIGKTEITLKQFFETFYGRKSNWIDLHHFDDPQKNIGSVHLSIKWTGTDIKDMGWNLQESGGQEGVKDDQMGAGPSKEGLKQGGHHKGHHVGHKAGDVAAGGAAAGAAGGAAGLAGREGDRGLKGHDGAGPRAEIDKEPKIGHGKGHHQIGHEGDKAHQAGSDIGGAGRQAGSDIGGAGRQAGSDIAGAGAGAGAAGAGMKGQQAGSDIAGAGQQVGHNVGQDVGHVGDKAQRGGSDIAGSAGAGAADVGAKGQQVGQDVGHDVSDKAGLNKGDPTCTEGQKEGLKEKRGQEELGQARQAKAV